MNSYVKTFANKQSFVQAIKVAVVGVLNTVVSFSLFNVFLTVNWPWIRAITVAFAFTTFMSYLINRRWTFQLKDGKLSRRETAAFFGINIAAYFASITIVWVADTTLGPLSRIGYNLALLVAAGLLILPKLAGYRDVVFSEALGDEAGTSGAGGVTPDAVEVP